MAEVDVLLAELGALATALGPTIAPPGAQAALQTLVQTAQQMFGAAACSLALLTADESELVYTAAAGEGAERVTGLRIASDTGLAGWVMQSGQPIAIADLSQDRRFDRRTAQSTGYVPEAMIVVPVESGNRTFGVLSLLDRDATRPGAQGDMTLLSVLATQAAVVIEALVGFQDLGRVLLAAVAGAASEGGALADALARAAARLTGQDADLASLATSFAGLAQQGPAERRLALGVLSDVAQYAQRRSSRTR